MESLKIKKAWEKMVLLDTKLATSQQGAPLANLATSLLDC